MKCAAVFVTDELYLEITRHAAAVFMINNENTDVLIYCDGFQPPIDKALGIAASERGIQFSYHSMPGDARTLSLDTHVTKTMLCKFHAINECLKYYDRVVYLDGDVLVLGPLPIRTLDFESHPVAAVYDIAEMGCMTDPRFMENVRENDLSRHYFNSGVIFANRVGWNADRFMARYESCIQSHFERCEYKHDCVTVDQCAFNVLFRDDWKRLPLSFNMQACAMFCPGWADATVRHYVGRRKFLPVRPGRNDSKDLAAINAARAILRLEPAWLPAADILHEVNRMRHRRSSKRAREVMEELDSLCFAAP